MQELDLLLQGWLRDQFDLASPAQRAAFEALLELPDPQLAHYLLSGQRPGAPELAASVDAVLANASIMSAQVTEPSPTATLQS
jgi:antitoxin CptB